MTGGEPEESRYSGWRRTLALAWIAELLATLGFSLSTPFLPLFLRQDMGVTNVAELARWTGVIGCLAGLSMAVASPIWGVLADRRGRKPMLVRALAGGALTTAAIGFAQTPLQVLGLRLVQGATSGTVSAATALVASETPPRRTAWALGVLSASIALGTAMGPVLGGVGASLLGFRAIYAVGGGLAGVATAAAVLFIKERSRQPDGQQSVSLRSALAQSDRATIRILVVLILGQGLLTYCQIALQQLAVLKVIDLEIADPAQLTGVAFGAGGLATAVSAFAAGTIARRFGYRWPMVIGSGAVVIDLVALALARDGAILAAAVVGFGVVYGVVNPLLGAHLGLVAPKEIQATAFGLNASSLAVGAAAGPLVTATLVPTHGTTVGLLAAAASGLVLTAMLALGAREPARAPSARVPAESSQPDVLDTAIPDPRTALNSAQRPASEGADLLFR